MILFDFSQVIIAQATDYHRKTKEIVDIDLLRHMTINSILNLKEKLTKYADEVVLCIDSVDSWRKDIFPFYKQQRQKSKQESTFNWALFYESMNILIGEFKENLPYKVMKVDKCETDDIIAVISMKYGMVRSIVIVSSDHDFLQIPTTICNNVKQYSPHHKRFLSSNDGYSLFEHVIKGDSGDGVPNIFSDDDCFITPGKIQKSVFQVKLDLWKQSGLEHPNVFCTSEIELSRFERNMNLVNFNRIPEQYQIAILDEYDSIKVDKSKLFNYLIEHKLRKIMARGNF